MTNTELLILNLAKILVDWKLHRIEAADTD